MSDRLRDYLTRPRTRRAFSGQQALGTNSALPRYLDRSSPFTGPGGLRAAGVCVA